MNGKRVGCLVDCMVACQPGRRSGRTLAIPSLASCVISVVVSPAIPEEAGYSEDYQLIDKPIGD